VIVLVCGAVERYADSMTEARRLQLRKRWDDINARLVQLTAGVATEEEQELLGELEKSSTN
jgi:hypothetical protein